MIVSNHFICGHLLIYGITLDILVPVSVIVPVISTSNVNIPTVSSLSPYLFKASYILAFPMKLHIIVFLPSRYCLIACHFLLASPGIQIKLVLLFLLLLLQYVCYQMLRCIDKMLLSLFSFIFALLLCW